VRVSLGLAEGAIFAGQARAGQGAVFAGLTMKTPRSLLAAALVSSAGWPALAAGTVDAVDSAKALFDRALEHLKAGRFSEACPAIEESYTLDPRPGTLFTLAECETKRGRLATAVQRYEEYLSLYATLPPEKKQRQGDRERVSRKTLATLLPQVPEVTITLPSAAPPSTRVSRDGVPVTASALGVPMRIDPGEHVFTTRAPNGQDRETRVTIEKGEKRAVTIEVYVPTTELLMPVVVTGAVFGAVSIVTGLAFFVVANQKASSADVQLAQFKQNPTACSPMPFASACTDLHATNVSADNLHNTSVPLLAIGSVVGAATITYAVWAKARTERTLGVRMIPVVGATGSGIWLTGRF
jgi:hypothetical protein